MSKANVPIKVHGILNKGTRMIMGIGYCKIKDVNELLSFTASIATTLLGNKICTLKNCPDLYTVILEKVQIKKTFSY